MELFSSRICPFAARATLVASLLHLDVTLTEIDLKNKDPAFVALYPSAAGAAPGGAAKVPVLRDGDFLLAESGVIAAYLVDQYGAGAAGVPFNVAPTPKQKALSALLVEQVGGPLVSNFYKLLMNQEAEGQALAATALLAALEALSKSIESCSGGPFFLGALPSLADIMVYPWVQRFGVLSFYRGFSVPQEDARFRAFNTWAASMAALEEVARTVMPDAYYISGYESYANPKPATA